MLNVYNKAVLFLFVNFSKWNTIVPHFPPPSASLCLQIKQCDFNSPHFNIAVEFFKPHQCANFYRLRYWCRKVESWRHARRTGLKWSFQEKSKSHWRQERVLQISFWFLAKLQIIISAHGKRKCFVCVYFSE